MQYRTPLVIATRPGFRGCGWLRPGAGPGTGTAAICARVTGLVGQNRLAVYPLVTPEDANR